MSRTATVVLVLFLGLAMFASATPVSTTRYPTTRATTRATSTAAASSCPPLYKCDSACTKPVWSRDSKNCWYCHCDSMASTTHTTTRATTRKTTMATTTSTRKTTTSTRKTTTTRATTRATAQQESTTRATTRATTRYTTTTRATTRYTTTTHKSTTTTHKSTTRMTTRYTTTTKSTTYNSTTTASPTTNSTLNDTDITLLNFALNLEYLEAEFYCAAVGRTPSYNDDVTGNVTGGRAVTFSSDAMRSYAEELATDEEHHVEYLRSLLGDKAVDRPNIDIGEAFNQAIQAALGNDGNSTTRFSPYDNEINFLIGAFIFEDVGVTAYMGALAALKNSSYQQGAAGILAVEAYHAAAIRVLLAINGGQAVYFSDANTNSTNNGTTTTTTGTTTTTVTGPTTTTTGNFSNVPTTTVEDQTSTTTTTNTETTTTTTTTVTTTTNIDQTTTANGTNGTGSGVSVSQLVTALSNLRAALGNGKDQSVFADGNSSGSGSGDDEDDDNEDGASANLNIVPTDENSLAFTRTPREVLNIVYGGANSNGGLFLPNGVTGDYSAIL